VAGEKKESGRKSLLKTEEMEGKIINLMKGRLRNWGC